MRKFRKIAGGGLAGILIVLAVVWAMRGVDTSVLRLVSATDLAALIAAVIASVAVIAVFFWVVTGSFDADPPVGLGRMMELVAASGLLNYVPIAQLGLWGRAGYLRQYHGLPMRQSLVILGVAAVATVMVSVGSVMGWIGGGAWLIVCMVVSGPIARRLLNRPVVHAWSWVLLRGGVLMLQALRLWLAFKMIGEPVAFSQTTIMAAAGTLVKLTGITPNGLGLREWVIAAITPTETAVALAAAMLDRLVEVVVYIISGSLGILVLSRRGSLGKNSD